MFIHLSVTLHLFTQPLNAESLHQNKSQYQVKVD